MSYRPFLQQQSSPREVVPPPVSPVTSMLPMVDWNTAQAILFIVQERVSFAVNRVIEFDEGHLNYLHTLFIKDAMAFWTVVDQIHERMLCADWGNVRDEGGFIHALISKIKPIPCDIPEPEFVQMLLVKLWPQQQQQQPSPPLPPPATISPSQQLQMPQASLPRQIPVPLPHQSESPFAAAAAAMGQQQQQQQFSPPMLIISDSEQQQQQQQQMAQQEMIALAFANIYTWHSAQTVIEMISARLSQQVGRRVVFDDKHRAHLRARYDADPLGFWSVLDQIQDRMMTADWAAVRNDARFVQSFLNKFEPMDVPLSEFMRDVIPSHSLVPYGYPPHVLRSSSFSPNQLPITPTPSNTPATIGVIPSPSMMLHSPPMTLQPTAPTLSLKSPKRLPLSVTTTSIPPPPPPPPQQQPVANVPSYYNSTPPNTTTSSASSSPAASSPAASSATTLTPSSTSTTRSHHLHLQRPGQQQQQQQTTEDPDMQHYPFTWKAALLAMDAIEERIVKTCGREAKFDEKHKHHLRQRWEEDPRGFFSIIDQIQERLLQSDWDSIRDTARYIQSLVNRFEPQSVLSKFMQTFITPPEYAAATAAAEAATADLADIKWEEVIGCVFPAIEQRATKEVKRPVLFDEKHKLHLKQRFDRDIGAFWSILDQVQERMAHSDWSTVRDDGRFIQSFITKAEPQLPLQLGEFLSSVINSIPRRSANSTVPITASAPVDIDQLADRLESSMVLPNDNL